MKKELAAHTKPLLQWVFCNEIFPGHSEVQYYPAEEGSHTVLPFQAMVFFTPMKSLDFVKGESISRKQDSGWKVKEELTSLSFPPADKAMKMHPIMAIPVPASSPAQRQIFTCAVMVVLLAHWKFHSGERAGVEKSVCLPVSCPSWNARSSISSKIDPRRIWIDRINLKLKHKK